MACAQNHFLKWVKIRDLGGFGGVGGISDGTCVVSAHSHIGSGRNISIISQIGKGLIELGYSPSPHGISASILNQAIASVNQWAWACNGFRLQSRTIHYHKKSVAGYHTEKNVQCTVKQGHRPPKARKLKDWLEQLEGLKERQIVEVLSLEACLKRSLLGNLEIELHPAADYESQATPRAQIRVVRYDGLRGRLENDLRGGLKTWWWEEERGNHVKCRLSITDYQDAGRSINRPRFYQPKPHFQMMSRSYLRNREIHIVFNAADVLKGGFTNVSLLRRLAAASESSRTAYWLVAVQILIGIFKAGFKDPSHPSRYEPSLPTLAFIELAKCLVSAVLAYTTGSLRTLFPQHRGPYIDVPLYSRVGESPSNSPDDLCRQPVLSTRIQYVMAIPVACLYLLRNRLMGVRREYAVQWTTDTFDVFVIIVVGIHTYLFLGTTVPLRQWTSAFLQITAILLARLFTELQVYNAATYSFLLLITLVSSTVLVMTSYVYQKMHDVSLHRLNFILFSSSLVGYCALSLLFPQTPGPSPPAYPRDVLASRVLIFLRVAEDILAIAVLRRTSAFTFSALRLLSTALSAPISFLFFKTAIGFSFVQWMSSILAIYAAASYFLDEPTASNAPSKTTTSLWPRPS
ncbi:hypothetical protein C8J57DRAFT_1661718 [Mycena rebaudengoi]|nr:hypothetical protein C8J57DRAFT_1661718 [Mycena rebaudengoi]